MLGTYPHLSATLEAVVVRGAQDNIKVAEEDFE